MYWLGHNGRTCIPEMAENQPSVMWLVSCNEIIMPTPK